MHPGLEQGHCWEHSLTWPRRKKPHSIQKKVIFSGNDRGKNKYVSARQGQGEIELLIVSIGHRTDGVAQEVDRLELSL